ncbi:MAG: hypothetical protein JO270_09435 [Acidobacteriaceae bacterium]|nr:hypothetical protein [Acidobacteriaceae bacterium]
MAQAAWHTERSRQTLLRFIRDDIDNHGDELKRARVEPLFNFFVRMRGFTSCLQRLPVQ